MRVVRKAVYHRGKTRGGPEQALLQALRKTDAPLQAGWEFASVSMFELSQVQNLYEGGARQGIQPCLGSTEDHGLAIVNSEGESSIVSRPRPFFFNDSFRFPRPKSQREFSSSGQFPGPGCWPVWEGMP